MWQQQHHQQQRKRKIKDKGQKLAKFRNFMLRKMYLLGFVRLYFLFSCGLLSFKLSRYDDWQRRLEVSLRMQWWMNCSALWRWLICMWTGLYDERMQWARTKPHTAMTKAKCSLNTVQTSFAVRNWKFNNFISTFSQLLLRHVCECICAYAFGYRYSRNAPHIVYWAFPFKLWYKSHAHYQSKHMYSMDSSNDTRLCEWTEWMCFVRNVPWSFVNWISSQKQRLLNINRASDSATKMILLYRFLFFIFAMNACDAFAWNSWIS